MRRYTVDKNIEVYGQTMLAFIDNVQQNEIHPILVRHKLTNVDSDNWYPLQTWLDVLNDLNKESNAMFNFVAVGMGIAKHSALPPEAEKLPFAAIMSNINALYQSGHRGGYVGEIQFEQVSETHLKFTLIDLVFPDDLEYGVAYGFAKRLLPLGTNIQVSYDPDVTRLDNGGDKTVIHLKWEK